MLDFLGLLVQLLQLDVVGVVDVDECTPYSGQARLGHAEHIAVSESSPCPPCYLLYFVIFQWHYLLFVVHLVSLVKDNPLDM